MRSGLIGRRSVMSFVSTSAVLVLGLALPGTGALACGLQDAAPASNALPVAALPQAAILPEALPAPSTIPSGSEPICPVALTGGSDLASTDASSCCDPALEPGTGGNPFCFEGHTCCANGKWACNNADGSPSCTACGAGCAPSGAPCTSNAACCSGTCKRSGRCR